MKLFVLAVALMAMAVVVMSEDNPIKLVKPGVMNPLQDNQIKAKELSTLASLVAMEPGSAGGGEVGVGYNNIGGRADKATDVMAIVAAKDDVKLLSDDESCDDAKKNCGGKKSEAQKKTEQAEEKKLKKELEKEDKAAEKKKAKRAEEEAKDVKDAEKQIEKDLKDGAEGKLAKISVNATQPDSAKSSNKTEEPKKEEKKEEKKASFVEFADDTAAADSDMMLAPEAGEADVDAFLQNIEDPQEVIVPADNAVVSDQFSNTQKEPAGADVDAFIDVTPEEVAAASPAVPSASDSDAFLTLPSNEDSLFDTDEE